jgi:DHA2 family multidrug resistance protein
MNIPRRALLLIITAGLASLLEIVDTSIVNVAIPTMMGNLGATLQDISWVVTGYIISNAVVLPLAGWLALRLGRRAYYLGCILLFTGTSVACGLAPNLETLVIFRIIQGLAGGALLPTSQALIQEALPPEQSGMASALYGMVVIIGPTIGPPLGGYLTDHFGWRAIFNINLPLGILAAFMASLYVEDYKVEAAPQAAKGKAGKNAAPAALPRSKAPIDFIGLALLISGIGFLQFVLERGQADDWFDSSLISCCSLAAIGSIAGFIWWELKTEHPIMDLRLFKNANLRYGSIIMGAVGFMLYSLIFFIPVFCSVILGFTATQTGIIFIPSALGAGAMMPIVGAQLRKRDPRLLVMGGILCVEMALIMITGFTPQTSVEGLFWPLLYRGLGMAFLFVPVNAMVLGSFTGPALGQVAGMTNLARQIGGSIGIAMLSTLFDKAQDRIYGSMVGKISPLNPALRQSWIGTQVAMTKRMAVETGMGTPAQLAAKSLYFRLKHQVFVLGFDQMMWVMVIIFTLTLVPLYFFKPPKHLGPADAGH